MQGFLDAFMEFFFFYEAKLKESTQYSISKQNNAIIVIIINLQMHIILLQLEAMCRSIVECIPSRTGRTVEVLR